MKGFYTTWKGLSWIKRLDGFMLFTWAPLKTINANISEDLLVDDLSPSQCRLNGQPKEKPHDVWMNFIRWSEKLDIYNLSLRWLDDFVNDEIFGLKSSNKGGVKRASKLLHVHDTCAMSFTGIRTCRHEQNSSSYMNMTRHQTFQYFRSFFFPPSQP